MPRKRFELDAQAAAFKAASIGDGAAQAGCAGAGEGEDLLASDDEGGFATASRTLFRSGETSPALAAFSEATTPFSEFLGFFAARAAGAVDGVHSPNRNDSQKDANAKTYRERPLSVTRRADLQLLGFVQFLVIGSASA